MLLRKWIYCFLRAHYKKIAVLIIGCYFLIFLPIHCEKHMRHPPCDLPPIANSLDNLLFDIAAVEASVDIYLVPNYVHFYRFGSSAKRLNLIDVLCLLAVFRNQQPDRIFIHTDDVDAATKSFSEYKYGRTLLSMSGFADALHFLHYPQPKSVFGLPFSDKYREWHISDLARLRILRKYGGIFLDNDVYLFRNINKLRKHELSLLSSENGIENSLIVAHRDSRMLYSWIKSYMNYDPNVALHHNSERILNLIKDFTPKPYIVKSGLIESNVQKFFNDDVPEMQHSAKGFAVNLKTQPRDEVPDFDYMNFIALYGQDFFERYFRLDENTRKRVNFVSRNLFDDLVP